MMQRGYFPYIFCRYNQLGELNVISKEKRKKDSQVCWCQMLWIVVPLKEAENGRGREAVESW